jgi:hypothetical protein
LLRILQLLSFVLLAIVSLSACGGRESAGSATTGDPTPDAGAASVDASAMSTPSDWLACSKSSECTLVPAAACCSSCHPTDISEFAAVSTSHTADFAARLGCAGTSCGACPAPTPDPQIATNFIALCQSGQCAAVDLRFSKYAACTTKADCAFVWGLGCCEGCDDSELVVLNPNAGLHQELCPVEPPCEPPDPACVGRRNPRRTLECVASLCQLSD